MNGRRRKTAIALALMMLLVPVLSNAVDLNLDDGDIYFYSETEYKHGDKERATLTSDDKVTIYFSGTDDRTTTTNAITLYNTGDRSITIKGEFEYVGDKAFLTLQGDVNELTFENAFIESEKAPALLIIETKTDDKKVATPANVTIKVDDGEGAVPVEELGSPATSLLSEEGPALSIKDDSTLTIIGGTLYISNRSENGRVIKGDENNVLITVKEGTVNVCNPATSSDLINMVNIAGNMKLVSDDKNGYTIIITPATPQNPPTSVTPIYVNLNPNNDPDNDPNPPGDTPYNNLLTFINMTGDPENLAAKVPLGNNNGNGLTLNRFKFMPYIDGDNVAYITNADLLAAAVLGANPDLYPFIGQTASQDNVTISQGAVFEGLEPVTGAWGVKAQTLWMLGEAVGTGDLLQLYSSQLYGVDEKARIREIKKILEETAKNGRQSGNEDWNFSNYQAMKLLEGQKYSINADDQNLINLGIGNVWQAPVPDKDYDPLSQYVPPEVPPNTGEPDESVEPEPE